MTPMVQELGLFSAGVTCFGPCHWSQRATGNTRRQEPVGLGASQPTIPKSDRLLGAAVEWFADDHRLHDHAQDAPEAHPVLVVPQHRREAADHSAQAAAIQDWRRFPGHFLMIAAA